MRIGEVAELTGLSISNIRFYEKKGLIEPDREKESKYRDYTQADVIRLKEIVLYRKMDMSIEVISSIINGEVSREDAMEQQMLDLKEKQKTIQGAMDLCQKVLKEEMFEEKNIETYLNFVKEEEAKGTKFAEIDEMLQDFADFAQMNRMIGDPYVGWLFVNPWTNRLVSILWMGILVALPVVGIVDDYLDDGRIRPVSGLFWIGWLLFVGVHFYQYRKSKKWQD